MITSDMSKLPVFEPPGPGSWEQDRVHHPRPMTRYLQETQPAPFKTGTYDAARFYGLPIDGLLIAYVNGFAYNQLLLAPIGEIPQRFARAEEVFAHKLWREQLRDWDENCKPAAIAKHRELQAVDPNTLPEAELIGYLTRCRDHHSSMIAQHMRFTVGAVLPTSDFLAHIGDWTGLPSSDLLGLLRGSAEVSSGGSNEMAQLKRCFAEDASARKVLESRDDPAEVLVRLRALGGDTGAAVSEYLDLVGHRLIDGFDIAEPTTLELPDALLRVIRIAVFGETPAASDLLARIAEVRGQVPAARRNEFDELLGEARLTYRLRDERGVYSDIWAAGLMRRAALSAGRRITERGRITDARQMLDATLDEMCALVAGSGGPSVDELAARAKYRATYTAKDAPALLGPPTPSPPDLEAMPPSAGRRVMRAMLISAGHVSGSSQAQHEKAVLFGIAASKGVYEGPARRVLGPSEFGQIASGDVLVTESITEAFNILLPLLGGIVTDNGGLLSHAAIVAREYGIPGVVGTREATDRIANGVRIRVDGDAGEVTVLG